MERKDFRKQVQATVTEIRKKQDLNKFNVWIDKSLPSIAIGNFFAQGESAQELLDGIPDDIDDETWLIYYLDSAGVKF